MSLNSYYEIFFGKYHIVGKLGKFTLDKEKFSK